MGTYISLLRGINVGGKTIRMAALKELYQELGLGDIRTYLQSGNVVFDSKRREASGLAGLIESRIAESLGLEVSVLIRAAEDLRRVIESNPFLHRRHEDPARLHVTFLATPPTASLLGSLANPEGETDEFIPGKSEIYLFCPNGYGRSKLSNSFFERKLKMRATTRNWNTVEALDRLAQAG